MVVDKIYLLVIVDLMVVLMFDVLILYKDFLVVDLIEEFLLNFFEHLDEQLIMNQQILIQVHEDFQQLVQLHLL